MKKSHKIILLISLIAAVNYAQSFNINLDSLSTLDEEQIHVTILKDKPNEKLILPDFQVSPKFIELFYSWESENDEKISIAIIQKESADLLYIDLNNDEDLTNDNGPVSFPLSQNAMYFEIIADNDPNQKTRLVLYRKPNLPDSRAKEYVDKEGNLLPSVAKIFGTVNNVLGYDGKRRTFFLDDRLGLRRGEVNIENEIYSIGLFDYNNNGLFNEKDDVLLIDLNRDGKLDYLHDEDIFRMNDVINIKSKNYKVSYADPYGMQITLEITDEKPTKYFSRPIPDYDGHKYKLDQEFWDTKFVDLEGNQIQLNKFKGKYVLLNFWGEWCMPCRLEIPDLISANKKYSNDLIIISFLKTNDLEKAKAFIKEKDIQWPQIALPEDVEKQFKITGYPTNILIEPDGVSFQRQGMIKADFFSKNLTEE